MKITTSVGSQFSIEESIDGKLNGLDVLNHFIVQVKNGQLFSFKFNQSS
jgi:hypothetical protein